MVNFKGLRDKGFAETVVRNVVKEITKSTLAELSELKMGLINMRRSIVKQVSTEIRNSIEELLREFMNDFAGITPFSCQEEVDCNRPIICHGRSTDKISLMSGDTRLEGGVKNHLEDSAAKRRLVYRGGDELRGQVNENNTSSIEALASCSMAKCCKPYHGVETDRSSDTC